LYNQAATRELHLIINGKNKSHPNHARDIHLKGWRCIGDCGLEKLDETVPEEGDPEIIIPPAIWSLNSTWPSGLVP
jgi:hypothetical protein